MSHHTAWDLGQGTRTELEPSWHLPKELLLELSGEVGARLPGVGYAFVADQLVQAVAWDLQQILLIVRWSASAGFRTFWVSYFYSNYLKIPHEVYLNKIKTSLTNIMHENILKCKWNTPRMRLLQQHVGAIIIGAAWLVLHFALTINKHATSKSPRIFC